MQNWRRILNFYRPLWILKTFRQSDVLSDKAQGKGDKTRLGRESVLTEEAKGNNVEGSQKMKGGKRMENEMKMGKLKLS